YEDYDVDYRIDDSGSSGKSGGSGNSWDWGDSNSWSWRSSGQNSRKRQNEDRFMAGMILIIIGLFFLLNQLNIVNFRDYIGYWPVLLMISGVYTFYTGFFDREDDYQVRNEAIRKKETVRDNETVSDNETVREKEAMDEKETINKEVDDSAS